MPMGYLYTFNLDLIRKTMLHPENLIPPKKGEIRNPKGRKKGTLNRKTLALRWLKVNEDAVNPITGEDSCLSQADLITLAQILLAKKGDTADQRPVTFSCNGGPGSSSVWLHLGLLGPQRVACDEMGNAPPPPYALVDNEHTLLTDSDLVFIDPVGTGHSRMAEARR